MKKALTLGVFVLLIVIGFLIRANYKPEQTRKSEIPGLTQTQSTITEVPDLTLKDYQDKTVGLKSFEGKPLIINAWAAWCPFCVKELRDFAAVQEEFKDKVVIIAVDRAESLNVAKEYTDELGVTDKLVFLLDPQDSFYKAIGGFSMPETIFVDKKGKVVDHKRGPMDKEEMRSRIEKIL